MIHSRSKALDKREYLVIIRNNFCHFCTKTCCDPSAEPSRRDGLDEGSQNMVSMRNRNNYFSIIIKYSSYLELCSSL